MNQIEINQTEDKFLYLTDDSRLRIADMKAISSNNLIFEANHEKYLNAKWLNFCEGIIAFTKNEVIFKKKQKFFILFLTYYKLKKFFREKNCLILNFFKKIQFFSRIISFKYFLFNDFIYI